jgi:hypothetical protein
MENVMKVLASILALGLLAAPALAATKTFTDVPVVDQNCSKKVAANPDAHTRDCALMCAKSGFGVITSDNQYLKFDDSGNKEIIKELKASSKKDHLRVDVEGDVQGDTLKVKSVKLL